MSFLHFVDATGANWKECGIPQIQVKENSKYNLIIYKTKRITGIINPELVRIQQKACAL